MKRIFLCRRSSLALIGIAALTWIALKNGTDVSLAVAGIVAGVAASNAGESAYRSRNKLENTNE